MDEDVSNLMIGMLSGTERDQFGREHHARRPLLLDTVMEGRKRVSRSRLLQMPAEILADVVDLLTDDKAALASLALVNSDCRQLARCGQFAEIRFDYSRPTRDLILQLGREACTSPRKLGIGTCVRRFTFASDPGYVRDFHINLHDSIWGEAETYSDEERDRLREEANDFYRKLRGIAVLAIPLAMPNLEVLVWGDRFSLDETFFRDVSHSSVRHLKLNRVAIDDPWLMEEPLTPKTWPICSLDLDLSLAYRSEDETDSDATGSDGDSQDVQKTESIHPISPFFRTLFQLCAPTLESLNWTSMDFLHNINISLGSNPVSFPRLRCLRLGLLRLDAPGFSSLMSAPLRHLELSFKILDKHGSSLPAYGPLRDLHSFVIDNIPIEEETCMHIAEFIMQHNHLQKLWCMSAMSNLRSLSLAWGGGSVDENITPHEVYIPEAALAAVGALVSLEQLSLCCGITFGWRHQWLVNHPQLRASLQGLNRLKKLALVRDTYPMPTPGLDAEGYYSRRIVKAEERADAEGRMELEPDEPGRYSHPEVEIWERAHRNRMLSHAEGYAAVLPALEWILCGQRPMALERDDESQTARLKAVPLTKCRDDCYTILRETFGVVTKDYRNLDINGMLQERRN